MYLLETANEITKRLWPSGTKMGLPQIGLRGKMLSRFARPGSKLPFLLYYG